jgi:exopolyphosphatase / guanosine-5'-triphosphate,3'-diphosphate pyrophosphatase
MARFAAIDIGSNAMRLRVVEVEKDPELPADRPAAWTEIVALRAPVRLGREVFLTGELTSPAISGATAALKTFADAMTAAKVDQYRAVATSAVREANNADALVERAHREAGIFVEVIEGVEEARLVQLAVTRRLRLEERRALLIDIGGGSTELTLMDRGELKDSQSLALGTVRLLEAFLEAGTAVSVRHANLVREYVERILVEMAEDIRSASPEVLIATGGNIDSLAALCPAQRDDGPAIDVRKMRKLIEAMSAMSVAERMETYSLREDRADTIVPAAIILLYLADRLRHGVILAPGVGLKEGILDELVDRHFSRWNVGGEESAIAKACLRLGRRYQFDERHGSLVAGLATQLFDDLGSLHGMHGRPRLLLHAAALLHDVGDFIRYEGHHKHSHYVIEHSDIMGITPAERTIVANVARYHRKSFPDPSHPNFRELSRDDRALVRSLSAILRLADALDREHLGKVSSVRAGVASNRLRLEITGEENHELETWTLVRKSGLFRAVFDLEVDAVDAVGTHPPRSRPPTAGVP